MDAQTIITQGVAASAFAKILVDLVKMSPVYSPPALLPILAFVFSEGCAFLLAGIDPSVVFDRATIFATVLIGIGATAGAIGITEAQKAAAK